MGEAVALREQLREVADPAPSLNDFIVKATALALREFPRVNGAYRDAHAGDVLTRQRRDRGRRRRRARGADDLRRRHRSRSERSAEMPRALAERVRDGSITPAELAGGTFTVSNLGMYGVDSFSAVINPPQAAILAVGVAEAPARRRRGSRASSWRDRRSC